MLRYGSGRPVSTSTTTTEDAEDSLSDRRIRRLRLTLHAGDDGNNNTTKTANSQTTEREREKDVSGSWKKKNGLIQRERPAGRESPQQNHKDSTNGSSESSSHGPRVYGLVQRTSSDRQQEVMAREWTVNHLQDEMKYIREVRDSLEKVREKMYGQFGGMQQSVQRLSQDLKTSNSQRRSLESEVKIRTSAMESFDQMNSSLISANISLQKSLLENCQSRVDTREKEKNLRSNYEKTQEKLRDREKDLEAAHAHNQALRLQVESSQEVQTQALQELSEKLKKEFTEKLQEEQRKHREEIERLQAQIDEYVERLEAAEKSIRAAETRISERDQRILDLERLLDCMEKEKSQLQQKLQDSEQRLLLVKLTDTTDSAAAVKRSKDLQTEVLDLRERIKHLNDMVFCQQRKVKGMIEEVETLRAQVAQKDMFISELLDRIAIVECENNELEDKLKYFMSSQNRTPEVLETREIGVGCDLLHRREDNTPGRLHPSKRSALEPADPAEPLAPITIPSPTELLSPSEPLSPAYPLSPTEPLSHTELRSPTYPLSPEPLFPSEPLSHTEPLSPAYPLSPSEPLSHTEPLSPAYPLSPSEPLFPSEPLSPAYPVSPSEPLFPSQLFSPSQLSEPPSFPEPQPPPYPTRYFSLPTQQRSYKPANPRPSRLESSLLRFSPVEYSRLLQSGPSVQRETFTYQTLPETLVSPVRSGRDEVDAETKSAVEESSSQPWTRTRTYTPFMKLMERTANIQVEEE